jgi:DNA-directed RNA polymerase subunit RPC12/RpoP
MPLYWVAKCKKCGKEAGIRPSTSVGNQLEMASPSEEIKGAKCPHCGAKNDFRGSDLREVLAYVVPSPPPSKAE